MYEIEETPNNVLVHNKIYISPKNHTYNVLTYQSSMVCMDDYDTGKYRSVVFSNHQLVSFSSPKSIPIETFVQNCGHSLHSKIPETVYITETIEGTMINLFYDHPNQTWEIATKNAVGGNYWYFRNQYDDHITDHPHTFRDMFMDAIGEPIHANINQTKIVQNLQKDCCYSFVLQHPENHIVQIIEAARVYLVAVYQITNQDGYHIARYLSIPYISKLTFVKELNDKGVIYFPNTIITQISYTELEQFLNYSATCESLVGYTLIDSKIGDRTKMENSRYNMKKNLRGNHPNLQYQYLCLWRIQKVPEFLKYFPIYEKQFRKFEDQLEQFINNIQTVYYMYYIDKQREFEFPQNVMYFVKRIHHELFIPSLKTPPRIIITRPVVRSWLMRNFEPSALLVNINFATNL